MKYILIAYCLTVFFIVNCNFQKTDLGANNKEKFSFGFRPEGMSMWDSWYIEHDGIIHVFYLQWKIPGSERSDLDENSIGHAISKDMVHWEEKPCVLPLSCFERIV